MLFRSGIAELLQLDQIDGAVEAEHQRQLGIGGWAELMARPVKALQLMEAGVGQRIWHASWQRSLTILAERA